MRFASRNANPTVRPAAFRRIQSLLMCLRILSASSPIQHVVSTSGTAFHRIGEGKARIGRADITGPPVRDQL